MAERAAIPPQTLRVSELTRYLKYLIEHDDLLSAVSVRGEVSNLSRSPSGHTYFSLKDASSQISCVLFRREAAQQREAAKSLRNGAAFVVHGFLTLYEPRGTFQVYVERIVPAGEGTLAQQFELLKNRLEAEGLFVTERKRHLPAYPRKLALVTSPGSQAYHDVLHRLTAQYPFVTVIVAGVPVQGEGAGDAMAMAIDVVNRLTDVDLILLVRGGGAPEELAAFNEERLARAIFASRVPIVTGIGHETDQSIADLVADYRAATPSLAAAAAVPDAAGLLTQIARLHAQLRQAMEGRVRSERRHLVDVNRSLLRAGPQTRLRLQRQRADDGLRQMQRSVDVLLRVKRTRLTALEAQLQALDPLAVLARGYSVLFDAVDGTVISRVDAAVPGRRLRARVADGEFDVEVSE